MDCDVVVIGAGLAGLECARTLHEHGIDVRVLEAGDAVGGKVRTDRVDGFTVDRGFQLVNPAYPVVRRRVDLPALDLRPFLPGIAVRRGDRLAILADPRRAPGRAIDLLRSGYLRPLELLALARWAAPALGRVKSLLARPDTTLEESFVQAGVEGYLRREVLEPFLAGVLATDDDGATSAAFVRLLVRTFVLGTPGVPAAGAAALPEQLAAHVPGGVTFGARAEAIEGRHRGVHRVLLDGLSVTARAVVVATDPTCAHRLAGIPALPMKGLVTYWYAADEAPVTLPILYVDGRRAGGRRLGPVVNAAVMSNVAPSYAPDGAHLVEVTCLLDPGGQGLDEAAARRQAAQIFGGSERGWRLIARHVIAEALPVQPAPLVTRRPVDLGGGLFVCGDHRDTASIQGAMVSGHRAAVAAARWLGS